MTVWDFLGINEGCYISSLYKMKYTGLLKRDVIFKSLHIFQDPDVHFPLNQNDKITQNTITCRNGLYSGCVMTSAKAGLVETGPCLEGSDLPFVSAKT